MGVVPEVRNVEVERQAGREEGGYEGAECNCDGWEEVLIVVEEGVSLGQPCVAPSVVLFPSAWVAFQAEDREDRTYCLDRTVEAPYGSFSPFPSVVDHVQA